MLNAFVIVLEVITSLLLILLVLLHSGKGGGLSDMFGGGGGLSGGTSAERTLDRLTITCAIVWGISTFWLSWKWV
jgi:preprotein translocase subunit SecG